MDIRSTEGLTLEQKVDMILKTVIKTSVDMEQMSIKVNKLEDENKQLKIKINRLENQINTFDSQNRTNYLVFYGIIEDENEKYLDLEKKVVNIIKHETNGLGLKDMRPSDIERVFRLGNNNSGKRPTVVKFLSYKTKHMILNETKKLKGTNYFVAPYYSFRDQDIRSKLQPYFEQARNNGDRAYLRHTRLWINEKPYTLSDCENTFKNIISSNLNQQQPPRSQQEYEHHPEQESQQSAADQQHPRSLRRNPQRKN